MGREGRTGGTNGRSVREENRSREKTGEKWNKEPKNSQQPRAAFDRQDALDRDRRVRVAHVVVRAQVLREQREDVQELLFC